MRQSSNGERAASHINQVRTKGRSLLDDDTTDAIALSTYNTPELHELTRRLSQKGGHPAYKARYVEDPSERLLSGGGCTKPHSQVVRRCLSRSTEALLIE